MNDGLAGPAVREAPQISMQRPNALSGNFDGVHGRWAEGWAFDAADPTRQIVIEVFDGERLLGEAPARLFRADLASASIGDGNHSFKFLLPLELFDGQDHAIVARVRDSDFVLKGSPRRLRTQALPTVAAFQSVSELTAVTPPLSDLQFTMLRSLHALTDALLVQSKAINLLLEQVRPNGAAKDDGRSGPIGAPDPFLAAAQAHPGGQHDYIFFAIIDWSFRIQRPQHLATRIAAMGNRVFYIGITFEPLRPGGRRFTIRACPAPGVFEVVLHCRQPAPTIYAGFDDAVQVRELMAAVAELTTELALKSPVGIIQFPSWLPIAAAVQGMTLIFDCMDHLAGFNGVAPRVVELEKTLIAEADGVCVSSEFLARMVSLQRDCEIVRNGADVAYFSRRPPTVFEPEGRPVIGYFGAIADWFDMDLVVACARHNPQWQFILIGEVNGCDISTAKKLPNIAFLGERPYDRLTYYLYSFDVCIVPFKLVDLIKATNPVKVYEYLCAGHPVVATDMPELRLLPEGTVVLAGSAHEFEKKIAACLNESNGGATRRRRSWAARQSWEARARKLSNFVARQFPKVSIVVLCHNNVQFTQACLTSVIEQSDYPDLEVICVDNASTDGTLAYLSEMASRHSFRSIRNDSNRGFAGGNNVGIRAASGDIVVLLNNDTYVTRGWVRDLIRPLLRNERIGMTGPVTNNIGNEQKIAIAYSNMAEMAMVSAAFTAPRRRQTYEVDALAFFCVAIRRDLIEKVGWLDEEYQLGFFEDDDYCARARRNGFRLMVCDDVFIHHHLSASFDQIGKAERGALMKRNRTLFESKWGPWKPHRYRKVSGFGDQ